MVKSEKPRAEKEETLMPVLLTMVVLIVQWIKKECAKVEKDLKSMGHDRLLTQPCIFTLLQQQRVKMHKSLGEVQSLCSSF